MNSNTLDFYMYDTKLGQKLNKGNGSGMMSV